MKNSQINFQLINWDEVLKTTHQGEIGNAYWQTLNFEGLRVRIVEYTEGYLADHWCSKGHIVHCLEGSFDTELDDGRVFTLAKGKSYIVSDQLSNHRSTTKCGVKLLIIDGDFLK